MAQVVVDANVIIAARLARDSNHERGQTLTTAFDRGELPQAVVVSDVLEEIYNYVQAKADQEVATETLDALVESRGYEIRFTPKADFDAGRSRARKYESLSLTDAVLVAFMQREEVPYLYSFDDGFDAVDGVTRFVMPEDPFSPD